MDNDNLDSLNSILLITKKGATLHSRRQNEEAFQRTIATPVYPSTTSLMSPPPSRANKRLIADQDPAIYIS
jgi:hypothetical protein